MSQIRRADRGKRISAACFHHA